MNGLSETRRRRSHHVARKIVHVATPLSPRDQFITIYGRIPVLEALRKHNLEVAKVIIADNAQGRAIDQIVDEAHRRDIEVQHTSPARIKRLAGNGKQDQGVVADIAAPRMARLSDYLAQRGDRHATLFLLDGVTNPSNVGMILRSATAAGIDGVILTRVGSPHVRSARDQGIGWGGVRGADFEFSKCHGGRVGVAQARVYPGNWSGHCW